MAFAHSEIDPLGPGALLHYQAEVLATAAELERLDLKHLPPDRCLDMARLIVGEDIPVQAHREAILPPSDQILADIGTQTLRILSGATGELSQIT